MRRLPAFLVAALMVATALVVRHRIDDHHADTTAAFTIACARELGDVCDDLQSALGSRISIEDAPSSADAFTRDTNTSTRGWIVPAPWPAIVEDARTRAAQPPVFEAARPLATSRLVMLTWPERARVLAAKCPNTTIDWKCVGNLAGQPWSALGGEATWGRLQPMHADPTGTTVGLLTLGQATVQYFGRQDLSRADLDDDGYRTWLSRLERALPAFVDAGGVPDQIVRGPAAFDVLGTSEAEVDNHGATQVLTPQPPAHEDVVFVLRLGTARPKAVRDAGTGRAVRDALRRHGWRLGSGPAAIGEPDTGTLIALRTLLGAITH